MQWIFTAIEVSKFLAGEGEKQDRTFEPLNLCDSKVFSPFSESYASLISAGSLYLLTCLLAYSYLLGGCRGSPTHTQLSCLKNSLKNHRAGAGFVWTLHKPFPPPTTQLRHHN